MRVFEHALNILDQLKINAQYLRIKWDLYQNLGLLPITYVPENIIKDIEDCKDHVRWINDSYERLSSGREEIYQMRYELFDDLKDYIYVWPELLTDQLNALSYEFRDRLVGITASEPIYGTEIAVRKFGGLQILRNAAETLIADYVSSIEDIEYKGLVVFGFRNRALTYPKTSLVILPSYTEHDLEYLIILAHEAYHIVNEKLSDKKKQEFNRIKKNLASSLKGLTDHFILEDLPEKYAQMPTADMLADEIMGDVYAICVAGCTFFKVASEYYLPISMIARTYYEETYPSYTIGAIRLRLAFETCKKLYPKEETIYKNYETNIEYWDNLMKSIVENRVENNPISFDVIRRLHDNIIKDFQGIPNQMCECIDKKFYPNISDSFKKEHKNIKSELEDQPEASDFANVWKRYNTISPRHLVALYVQSKKRINPNALLLALANHELIINRFKGK
jgi:hypothetical protein